MSRQRRKGKRLRINPSWEDGLRLIEEAEGLRNKLLLRLLLFQGLREGEILGSYDPKGRHGHLKPLTIGDVDFERNIITVRGKGDKVEEVFLDSETKEMLEEWIHRKRKPKPDKPIFYISTRMLQYIVKHTAIKAGVENAERFSPHVLRALSITRMIHKKDLARAKHHARHSSPITTMIYDRPSTEERRKDFRDVFES